MEVSRLSEIIVSDKKTIQQWVLDETGVQTEHLHFHRQGSFLWSKKHSQDTTMILFRVQPNAVVVKQKKENGYLAIPLYKTKSENIVGSVCISPNGYKGTLLKNKDKKDALILKSANTFSTGERFLVQPNCECKGETLYGCQASSLAIFQLAISVIKVCSVMENPVTVAYVNESIAGQEEALRLIASEKPERVVICSAAAENEIFSVGSGPALVLKDGNGIVTEEFRQTMEEAAQGCGLTLSYFIGNEDVAFAKMYLSAKKHHFGGLYLSVKEKSSGFEEISLQDVEKTRSLLLKYLSNFAIINK